MKNELMEQLRKLGVKSISTEHLAQIDDYFTDGDKDKPSGEKEGVDETSKE